MRLRTSSTQTLTSSPVKRGALGEALQSGRCRDAVEASRRRVDGTLGPTLTHRSITTRASECLACPELELTVSESSLRLAVASELRRSRHSGRKHEKKVMLPPGRDLSSHFISCVLLEKCDNSRPVAMPFLLYRAASVQVTTLLDYESVS